MAQGKRARLLVITLRTILCAAAFFGQTAIADDVLSPLVAIPIASPNPVLGADNKIHLPYEIVLVNMAAGSVSLKKIETLDADSDVVLGTLEGDGLAQMIKLNGGANGCRPASRWLGHLVHGRDARWERPHAEGAKTALRDRGDQRANRRFSWRPRSRAAAAARHHLYWRCY